MTAASERAAGVAAGQTSDNHTPLTNDEVIKLVRAGFKDKTVVSIIAARPAAYDLSPDRMIELKRHGVSEKIIVAMLARQQGSYVDDETWNFHLRQGDYSQWFRKKIKDAELAEETCKVESGGETNAAESRRRIRELVEARYTLPSPSLGNRRAARSPLTGSTMMNVP